MYKHIISLMFALFLLRSESSCQDKKKIDSLTIVLARQSGADRFSALYQMAFEYIHNNNERALALINEAERAAFLSGDSVAIVKSLRVRGQLLRMLERSGSAIQVLSKALPIAKRNSLKREQYHIENALGIIDIFSGKYDAALKRYYDLLPLVDEFEERGEYADVLQLIAVTYYKLKDYSTARVYYHKSLENSPVPQDIPSSYYSNLALCYAHLGDYNTARSFAALSFGACGLSCSDAMMMNAHYALGVIALGQRGGDEAETHFLRSYAMAVSANNSRFQLDNIIVLGDIYLQRRDTSRAESILLAGDSIISRGLMFEVEKIKVYSRLSDLYIKARDYRRASEYQAKYISLRDSVYNEELTTRLMKAEAEFLERENEAKLSAQSQIIALKEQIITGQYWLNGLASVAAVLSIILSAVLYRSHRRSKKVNMLLDRKIHERTNDLEAYTNGLLAIIKSERFLLDKLARDIRRRVSTLRALCVMARGEMRPAIVRTYIERINCISDQLSSDINCATSRISHSDLTVGTARQGT